MTVATLTLDLVDRSADPERVRATLARVRSVHPDLRDRVEADPAMGRSLVAVLAASRSLGRVLVADPAALEVLADDAGRAEPPPGDLPDLVAWARRELLRLAGRDLTGVDRVEDTTAGLAVLAEDVLQAAHRHARAHLGADDRLAVIGMGKLGGSELNYASDVDLMVAGEGDHDRLGRAVRSVLDGAGQVFRVDTGLRPEGRDGPLVRTVESYAAYWQRWAQPWERQALLKARPVAGDASLGAAWAAAGEHALWAEPFGADDLRQVRAMKQRVEHEVRARGERDRDVKRGPGGIRDVEFAAQLLQLVHGRADPELRARGTLDALDRLRDGGYVDPDDASVLATSYRFLRRVEHAAQLEDERQTHVVPADRAERRRLARVLGFTGTPEAGATEAFDRELGAQRTRVRTVHERLWFRPLLASLSGAGPLGEVATAERLAAFGFRDPERTRQAVAELTNGLTRSSRMMEQLLPLLLDWLSASPDPHEGLLGLRRLASGEQRTTALATAFRDSPEVARHLALLLGTSRLLGDVLAANPDLIERLPQPERLLTRPTAELAVNAVGTSLWREEPDDRQRALHRWTRRNLLGVGARDVFGHAGLEQVGADLSRLADVTLSTALRSLDPQVPFAVIALGRLGGQELGYASDLDVAFVHDGLDQEEAERVAAGLLRFVGGGTPAERMWAVDATLRPEGRVGPLARSVEAWVGYLDRWASVWERQAYLRARAVAGDPELGARLVEQIRTALVERPIRDHEEVEVRRMKVRIDKERIAPGEDADHHLKLGRGSISDVEFTVQLLQLRHGLVQPSTRAALAELVEAGHLAAAEADVLEEAYRFCEQVRNRRFLVAGPGDSIPTRPELVTPLARSLDLTVPELRDAYRRVTRRARRVVDLRFYGRANGV